MRITHGTIRAIDVPLKEPFIVSYATYHAMPAIIVELHTDDGLIGYGESVPDQHVTGETLDTVWSNLKDVLLPKLIGMDPRNINEVHAAMNSLLTGNGAAKAAVDIACYDLLGKSANLPVYALLGGRKTDDPYIAKTLSILPPEEAADQAEQALGQGFRHLKVKLGHNLDHDEAIMRAIVERVGGRMSIRVDVNQGWRDVATARRMLEKFADYHLDWVEQPISATNIPGFAQLRDHTGLALMADEPVITTRDLRAVADTNAVDYVNLKLMKSGGIKACADLATQAELFGIKVQIGSMLETSVASAAAFHLALAHRNIVSTEMSGPIKFTQDVGNLRYEIPRVHIPDAPGLGITVDTEALAAMTSATTTIGQQS